MDGFMVVPKDCELIKMLCKSCRRRYHARHHVTVVGDEEFLAKFVTKRRESRPVVLCEN